MLENFNATVGVIILVLLAAGVIYGMVSGKYQISIISVLTAAFLLGANLLKNDYDKKIQNIKDDYYKNVEQYITNREETKKVIAESIQDNTKESLKNKSDDDIEQYFKDLEKDHEEITFDQESGVVFINNELIIMAAQNVNPQKIEEIVSIYNGVVSDAMEDIGFYKVRFKEEYTMEAIETLIAQLIQNEEIENVYINPVLDDTEENYHTP